MISINLKLEKIKNAGWVFILIFRMYSIKMEISENKKILNLMELYERILF